MVTESGQPKWIQLKALTPIIPCGRATIMPQSHSRNVVLPSASASLAFCLVPNVGENCLPAFCAFSWNCFILSHRTHKPSLSTTNLFEAVKKKGKEVSLFYLVTFSLNCSYSKLGIQTCIVWEFRHPTDFSRTSQIPKPACKNSWPWSD